MDTAAESSSDFSETEYGEGRSYSGPFKDDPVWDPSLANNCDVQGSLGNPLF
jgi:hypothetical protein